MSVQPADTAFDAVVWHEDRSCIQWCGCPRFQAYVGDWTLIAYERGEWMVMADQMPRAGYLEKARATAVDFDGVDDGPSPAVSDVLSKAPEWHHYTAVPAPRTVLDAAKLRAFLVYQALTTAIA